MRICLVGDSVTPPDDSHKVAARCLVQSLGKRHSVLPLRLRGLATPRFWWRLRSFRPQVIHYVPGASLNSFLLMKLLSFYCSQARTVISAARPYFSHRSARLLRWLQPDLVLTQSKGTESKLMELGLKTHFLPYGVDLERFVPASPQTRSALRGRYGVEVEKPILLHVGSVKPGRGVHVLAEVQRQRPDIQVIIVGPTSVGFSPETKLLLEEAGCRVWMGYQERVQDIYALANWFVYPTVAQQDRLGRDVADSAETPLSVLEAMACNLPILTTPFGALPRIFTPGDGLFFCQPQELLACLDRVRDDSFLIKTRDKVLPYSWDQIACQLEAIYQELLGDIRGK